MILLNLTNEKLEELSQNATWKPLVDKLTMIQSLNTAKGKKPQNREGWVEVGDGYLSLPVIVALAGEDVEFKPVNVYVEVANAYVDEAIPSGLPNATRNVLIDDVEMEVENAWSDIEARVSVDGSKIICSFNENLTVAQIGTLLATPNITPMNHADTLAVIRAEYDSPDVI
jgi:hypothetical protein